MWDATSFTKNRQRFERHGLLQRFFHGVVADARRRARQGRRTNAHRASQRARKRIEEIFGWMKSVGGRARARHVGRWKIQQTANITAIYHCLGNLPEPTLVHRFL